MTAIRTAIKAVWDLILREPVYTQALVVAAIATGTAFGLGWSGAQVGAVSALSAAFLAFLTKQAVTPLSEPSIPSGTEVTVVTAAGQPNEKVTV
jgi:hypothetical protein